jgi:RNA polymerase subunit RPABC4/transcription elongation factor Spt4
VDEAHARVISLAWAGRRMSAIGSAIGDAVAAFFGDPLVGVVARLVGAYIVLVWLAVALWAFVDMRRRTAHLASAYGAAALVILASPLLFPLAVVILRIVRPGNFVAEHRLALARESVLQADFLATRCPDCRRVIDPDWILCPSCRQTLAHVCDRCGRTVELDWPVCAWCGGELLWGGGVADVAANA